MDLEGQNKVRFLGRNSNFLFKNYVNCSKLFERLHVWIYDCGMRYDFSAYIQLEQ
jgi:hypothetical protein